jgi:hypothetical protein
VLPQKDATGVAESVNMGADEKFARWLIGQQQQLILKAQRVIDETRAAYGLKE